VTALGARARPEWPNVWIAVATASGAGIVAVLLAGGDVEAAALLATAPILVSGLGALAAALRRVGTRQRMVGLVYALLLAGTLVWRVRTTQSLDSNPLDLAASVRIALVTAAGVCAVAFVFTASLVRARLPTSLRFLLAYIVVAAIAALDSPRPLQALYRVYELGLGFVAITVALALLGERAGPTIVRIVVGAMGVLVAIVWIEAIVFPSRAWSPTVSVFPYELQGYLPAYSTNAVGTFGGFLAIWGLVRPGAGRWSARLALFGGVATLLAAQYRTGIIGFLAAAVVVGWRRKGLPALFVPVAAALAVGFFGWHTISAETSRVFAKGRPELVSSLDSRTIYWHAALPLVRERPLVGWGLGVASRQVLVSLGDNSTSTIHSTWVEAVLGTGVAGAAMLALAYLTATVRALRASRDRLGLAVAAMLVYMVVRSLTGTTAEIFDVGFVVFASLALVAEQVYARERRGLSE
jgi:exopolysaccharide production protein ExoQ